MTNTVPSAIVRAAKFVPQWTMPMTELGSVTNTCHFYIYRDHCSLLYIHARIKTIGILRQDDALLLLQCRFFRCNTTVLPVHAPYVSFLHTHRPASQRPWQCSVAQPCSTFVNGKSDLFPELLQACIDQLSGEQVIERARFTKVPRTVQRVAMFAANYGRVQIFPFVCSNDDVSPCLLPVVTGPLASWSHFQPLSFFAAPSFAILTWE